MPRLKWQPIPGLQSLAVDTRADQTLYCGTRGCGKTAAQLMFFAAQTGKGFGPDFKGILLDTEYKALEDIKAQGKKFFESLGNCKFKDSFTHYYFEWSTGEKLFLRAAKTVADARKHLGHEYSYIMFNELSKWQNSQVYDFFLANLRVGRISGGPPRRVFSTTNPYGPGTTWIKRRFVQPVPAGHLNEEIVRVPWTNNTFKEVTKTKILISGNYTQNPHYRPEDVANLMESVKNDPARKAAWLFCDWDASFVDGAFGDLWKREVHIVPDFPIPKGWRVDRSFDWGSSTPFSVCWFAESNGEEFKHDGKTYFYPRGTVILFAEWYGSRDGELGQNAGSRLTPTQVAVGIKNREIDFQINKILEKGHKIYGGPADNQIANVNQTDVDTIKIQMEHIGVYWDESDKSAGSRNQGFNITRQCLHNSLTKEGAGFYIQTKCRRAIELIPSLQRDETGLEDIDKGQEDHIYDAVRYRLLAINQGVLNIAFSIR